ncbi:zinc finger protein [Penicillium brevicompactum]|uniref:Zinc finger C2H2 n=1 Tax=Penicillium brevicompactum TaxID=5074 RepID=UPI00254005D7|nr:Zinc finger C2H2 [Penicillium brevicompactum]KAJ5333021.1 Zinc finger C2H2 [Penicillium brevicompactum]
MFECDYCTDTFYEEEDCDEHMDEYNHWVRVECETCDRRFRSQNACQQHMNATNHHKPKHGCDTCTKMFFTSQAAMQHMQASGHRKNFCQPCNRQFMNENNFRAHMNSKTHRGKQVKCPFCTATFVTASGASHHLETGACPNARHATRESIHRAISQLDPTGIITKKQIGWHDERNSTYSATDAAFNGRHWICYFCSKGFGTRDSLNKHLNSPVHQSKIYHCLNKRGRCTKEFVSLAALFNHLESESCGFTRFENVQKFHNRLNDAVQNRRMITGLAI